MSQILTSETSFTLSKIQQYNGFLHKRAPEGLTDKLSGTLQIKSAVDIGAVKAAFQTLIDRRLGRGKKVCMTQMRHARPYLGVTDGCAGCGRRNVDYQRLPASK